MLRTVHLRFWQVLLAGWMLSLLLATNSQAGLLTPGGFLTFNRINYDGTGFLDVELRRYDLDGNITDNLVLDWDTGTTHKFGGHGLAAVGSQVYFSGAGAIWKADSATGAVTLLAGGNDLTRLGIFGGTFINLDTIGSHLLVGSAQSSSVGALSEITTDLQHVRQFSAPGGTNQLGEAGTLGVAYSNGKVYLPYTIFNSETRVQVFDATSSTLSLDNVIRFRPSASAPISDLLVDSSTGNIWLSYGGSVAEHDPSGGFIRGLSLGDPDSVHLLNAPAPSPVPEPGSFAIFGLGTVGVGLVARYQRRRRTKQACQGGF